MKAPYGQGGGAEIGAAEDHVLDRDAGETHALAMNERN